MESTREAPKRSSILPVNGLAKALVIIMTDRPAKTISFARPRSEPSLRPIAPTASNVVPHPINCPTARTLTVLTELGG
ncbi:hypothetical protein D3C87_1811670 [compost metagenome]